MYNVLLNWNLDNSIIEPIGKGISSDACLITVNDNKYILRMLSSEQQGNLEFKIAEGLSVLGISPRIIPTYSGSPFVEVEGKYYNLQEYICGKQIDTCDESLIQQIAKTIADMHKELNLLDIQLNVEDRFSLTYLLDRCKWENLKNTLIEHSENIEKFKNLCFSLINLDQDQTQWIHGDLGTWNLLCDDKKIKVIDFGECRKGSIYFDIAAVITSLLSNMEDTESINKYMNIFVQTYSKYNISLDRNLLAKYFQLWFVRGILTNTLEENYQAGKSEKVINYFWKQLKKFCYTEDVFTI